MRQPTTNEILSVNKLPQRETIAENKVSESGNNAKVIVRSKLKPSKNMNRNNTNNNGVINNSDSTYSTFDTDSDNLPGGVV